MDGCNWNCESQPLSKLNTFQKRDVMPPEIKMTPLKDMDAYATL